MRPKISVIIPAYNHEKYIQKTLRSVLDQSFTDIEVLLFDDCSSDGTADAVKDFSDERLNVIFSPVNCGTVAALNTLLSKARGEYIAVIGSDDFWLPEKLEKQLFYLEAHPQIAACFTRAIIVDENDEQIASSDTFPLKIFDEENRDRAAFLCRMFLDGNHLCHSSVMIRADVHKEIGEYRYAYRQLHDFDLWVRLLLKYDIAILDEKLVGYRVARGGSHVSQSTKQNTARLFNEAQDIFTMLFDEMDDETFQKGFFPYFRNKDAKTHDELVCERFFMVQKHGLWGESAYSLATHLLFQNLSASVLSCFEQNYGISLKDLYAFTGEKTNCGAANGCDHLNTLKAENAALSRELQTLLSSTSWRLTKPFRKITRAFSKKGRG